VILFKDCDFGKSCGMSPLMFSFKSPSKMSRDEKVDIGRQGLSFIIVFEELQSVIIGDGMDLVLRSI
jgi:hypothetical protein